jgi:hypothetical protein
VPSKRPLSSRGVRKQTERERATGLDPDDEAARWLAEHDPPPEQPPPKSAHKSKALHRWKQQQRRPTDRHRLVARERLPLS